MNTVQTKAQFYTKDVTELFTTNNETAVRNVTIYKNFWWLCRCGDPKQAIFYQTGAPQCNSNRRIMEHVYESGSQSERIGRIMAWDVSVIQIPLAVVPER